VADSAERPWLIVGLGNPGDAYAGNRHNAGFMVADVLAARVGGRFKAHRSHAEVIEGRLRGSRVVLGKPRTFMNESGGPVARLRDFFNVPLERVIVTIQEHGNTSTASVPLALDIGLRDGRIKRGDLLLLEALGGGLTWGSALLRY